MSKKWLTSRKFTSVMDLTESLKSLVDLASMASQSEDCGAVLSDEVLVGCFSSDSGENEAILYQETLSDGSHAYNIEIYA